MVPLLARCSTTTGYLGCIVGANWLTDRYGLRPVGFGLVATAGTYAAGTAFVARNALQDTAGRVAALGAIVGGAALSAWLATPVLALVSTVAFLISEGLDMAIYTPLRRRGWARAAILANVAGATIDTAAFMGLVAATGAVPHFALTRDAFAGQWIGKLWITWATVAVVLAVRTVRHAVLRHRLDTAGA